MPKKDLFGDDDEEVSTISVNTNYAKKFQVRKEKEAKSNLQQQIDDGELDSSSSSEYEDQNGLKREKSSWDKSFLEILPKIKSKNPEIYDKNKTFFDPVLEDEDEELIEEEKKKYTINDYVRESLLNKVKEEDNDDKNDKLPKETPLSYVEEQEQLKKAFLDAVEENETNSDDLLKLRTNKPKEEIEREEKEFQKFEKEMSSKEKLKLIENNDFLKEYWDGEQLDENEKFLRNFFIHEKWIEKDQGIPTYQQITDINLDLDDDSEEELENQDKFEKEYNFRFEENDGAEIITHSRSQPQSMRKDKKTKRSQKKAEKKKNKELEISKKQEELKRLKNVEKKKEKKKNKIKEEEDYEYNENDEYNDIEYNEDEIQEPQEGDFEFDNEEEENKEYGEIIEPEHTEELTVDQKLEYMEKFFKSDFEDMVGDLPTRFNYIEVPKNNYGMSITEILSTEEADLNSEVSLKKLAPYREKEWINKKRGQKFSQVNKLNGGKLSLNNTNKNNTNNNNYQNNNTKKRKLDDTKGDGNLNNNKKQKLNDGAPKTLTRSMKRNLRRKQNKQQENKK